MAADERAIDAPFEIESWDEVPYDEPASGPKLTRVTIRKRYNGSIEGSGVTEVLTTQGADRSGYVASERIVGTLNGSRGSFVIQHGGLADGADQTTFGTIVPNSGTDQTDLHPGTRE